MQAVIARNWKSVKWSNLHCVLIVANAKSIKKAAVQLKTTESTVSRRVSNIESALGFSIFERTPMGVVLTKAGEKLVQHLTRAEAEVEAGLEEAINQQNAPKGRIRLTTVPTLMNYLLIPATKRFFTRYPEIELELVGLAADLSMMRREADIAIRLARPSSDLNAVTRRLGAIEYGVFTSTTAISNTDKSVLQPWVTYEKDMSQLPQAKWIEKRTQESNESISMLRCNDADGLIQALRNDLGRSLLPKLVASNIPDLEELPGYDNLPSREIWLLVHPNVIMTKRIRVVIDWLQEIFRSSKI